MFTKKFGLFPIGNMDIHAGTADKPGPGKILVEILCA